MNTLSASHCEINLERKLDSAQLTHILGMVLTGEAENLQKRVGIVLRLETTF
jgi:hypothetical protein